MAKIIQLCYLTTTRTQQDTNGKGDGKGNKNTHTQTDNQSQDGPFWKRQYFFVCLLVLLTWIFQHSKNKIIIINSGHSMQTTECTRENSAFEYFKQQKQSVYMTTQ